MHSKKLKSGLMREIVNDQKGEGYVDFLIKILITVVIGSMLMGLMRLAVPDIFEDILDKIQSMLSI